MTTEYKNLALDLKYQYEAKVRLLKVYKALLLQGFTLESNNTIRVTTVNNNITRELHNNIQDLKKDLREIHLFRAFIKGVPYRKVEPNTPKPTFCHFLALQKALIKNYKLSENKASALIWDTLTTEFIAWLEKGIPSKFFAKPETVVN